MYPRHFIKLIWESPTTGHKTSHRHKRLLSFKTPNQMASRLIASSSLPRVFFQLLQFSRQPPSFTAYRAALMTKTDLTFPAFSLRFVDFARATLESGLTVVWFSWTNHNSLLRIVTNEIASFCTDNRLRQMAFLVFVKVGQGRLSSYVEIFEPKRLYL